MILSVLMPVLLQGLGQRFEQGTKQLFAQGSGVMYLSIHMCFALLGIAENVFLLTNLK